MDTRNGVPALDWPAGGRAAPQYTERRRLSKLWSDESAKATSALRLIDLAACYERVDGRRPFALGALSTEERKHHERFLDGRLTVRDLCWLGDRYAQECFAITAVRLAEWCLRLDDQRLEESWDDARFEAELACASSDALGVSLSDSQPARWAEAIAKRLLAWRGNGRESLRGERAEESHAGRIVALFWTIQELEPDLATSPSDLEKRHHDGVPLDDPAHAAAHRGRKPVIRAPLEVFGHRLVELADAPVAPRVLMYALLLLGCPAARAREIASQILARLVFGTETVGLPVLPGRDPLACEFDRRVPDVVARLRASVLMYVNLVALAYQTEPPGAADFWVGAERWRGWLRAGSLSLRQVAALNDRALGASARGRRRRTAIAAGFCSRSRVVAFASDLLRSRPDQREALVAEAQSWPTPSWSPPVAGGEGMERFAFSHGLPPATVPVVELIEPDIQAGRVRVTSITESADGAVERTVEDLPMGTAPPPPIDRLVDDRTWREHVRRMNVARERARIEERDGKGRVADPLRAFVPDE